MFYIEDNNKIVLFDEDKQKLQDTIAFMPQYEGLEIKEVEEGYVIYDFELMTVEEMKTKEAQKERERLDNLSMTRGDVFEALIFAKGLGKAQIRSMIEQAELDTVTKALYLNRFDEALEFYRGYPIFDMLGQVLGITGEMLDRFFDTNDWHYLTNCNIKVTLRADEKPETETTVTINGVETKETTLPYGSTCTIKVECDGYKTLQPEDFTVTEDMHIELQLIKEEQATDKDNLTVDEEDE